jgi:hypothetical protein
LYKPNIEWNEMFAPDAKETFDKARGQYAELKTVPFNTSPESAKGRLWINGAPVYRDVPLTVNTGTNYIQILGPQIENITLEVVDSISQIDLVVPSSIDEIGLDWLENTNRRSEIGPILNLLYPDHPTYFVLSDETIWEYNPSSQEWLALEVPVSAKVFSLDTRRRIGRAMFWSGMSISAVYGSKSAQEYARLTYLANTDADTWSDLQADYTDFQATEDSYQRHTTYTMVGAALTGLGWLMSR